MGQVVVGLLLVLDEFEKEDPARQSISVLLSSSIAARRLEAFVVLSADLLKTTCRAKHQSGLAILSQDEMDGVRFFLN